MATQLISISSLQIGAGDRWQQQISRCERSDLEEDSYKAEALGLDEGGFVYLWDDHSK